MQDVYPGFMLWPVWISAFLVPIGFGLLELRLVQRIYMLITRRRQTNYAIVDTIERTFADDEVASA